jgi:hypothetical protein
MVQMINYTEADFARIASGEFATLCFNLTQELIQKTNVSQSLEKTHIGNTNVIDNVFFVICMSRVFRWKLE